MWIQREDLLLRVKSVDIVKRVVKLICHADKTKNAEYVRAKVEEKYHPNKIIMSEVGPIVGAHVGPGTMVLIFEGDKR